MMSNIIWHQADRETPNQTAVRNIHQAEAVLRSLQGVLHEELADWHKHPMQMLGRVYEQVSTALNVALTLAEAYDYFLHRCLEAGMSAEDAQAAWNIHSSAAFEAEVVEAESYGPNAMRMIDATILSKLHIAPLEAPEHSGA